MDFIKLGNGIIDSHRILAITVDKTSDEQQQAVITMDSGMVILVQGEKLTEEVAALCVPSVSSREHGFAD